MNVFAFGSGLIEILHAWSLTKDGVGDLWQLSLDVEGESTESLYVNTSSSAELLIQVCNETSPDNKHLGFGLKWLLVTDSSLRWVIMLAWVVAAVLKNPKNTEKITLLYSIITIR